MKENQKGVLELLGCTLSSNDEDLINLAFKLENILNENNTLGTELEELKIKHEKLEWAYLEKTFNSFNFVAFSEHRFDYSNRLYPFSSDRNELLNLGITKEKQFAYITYRINEERKIKEREEKSNEQNLISNRDV